MFIACLYVFINAGTQSAALLFIFKGHLLGLLRPLVVKSESSFRSPKFCPQDLPDTF